MTSRKGVKVELLNDLMIVPTKVVHRRRLQEDGEVEDMVEGR